MDAVVSGLKPSQWDRTLLDEWVRRLGAERMRGVLAKLRDHLRALAVLAASESDLSDDLQRLAHDAASTAGMLGFTDVTRSCRALIEPGICPDAARSQLAETLATAIVQLDSHLSIQRQKVAA